MIKQLLAAYRAVREQQKKAREYEEFRSQTVTLRVMDEVINIAKRRSILVVVKLKDGTVIESHGEKQLQQGIRARLAAEAQRNAQYEDITLSELEEGIYG